MSEVSITSGADVMLCTAKTAAESMAGSSIPGKPTLTSSKSAPCEICVNASLQMKFMSFSRRAVFNFGLPVGLIRSPIIFKSPPRTTVFA
jgi:hypothetical protein